jgi:competence protein ComFC
MASGLLNSARDWLNAGLALIYPEVCQLCRQARASPAECYVCAKCVAGVRFVQQPFCERCGLPFPGDITHSFECSDCRGAKLPFRSARSAVIAKDQVLEIVHGYKYRRALWFEPLLAQWLIAAAKPELAKENWDFIVPVPLHPTKLREREFNQAERLARHLSAATKISLDNSLLRRVVPTQTQTLLSREERQNNVRRAFAMRKGKSLAGQRVVLVDDVFTTGATTGACARVLRDAGAGEVCVWTAARGI